VAARLAVLTHEIGSPWRFEFTPSHDSKFHIIGSGRGHLLMPDPTQRNTTTAVQVSERDVVWFPHGHADTRSFRSAAPPV
jgi:hypothetical protein